MRAHLLAFTAVLLPVPTFAQAVVASPAPAQADPALPSGKLPDTAKPVAYRLDFTIVPEQERFSGHAEIDVDLKAPAASIFMHGRDLKIAKAVAKVGRREIPVTFTQKNPLGLAQLDFGRTVPAGRVTLKFDYDAAFGEGQPAGLYRVKVADEWYSWTQFQSIDARAAFPSFDEPGYKTPFTVSITTKPGFVALSNAPETGMGEAAGALVKHRFIPTEPLPTYLVAAVTGPFVTAEAVVPPTPQRTKPLPLRIVGTKPYAAKLQYALDESGKIVSLLERYFDQPFPYPKLDQIGSPVMPGAMENAGADIYGDGILFLDESAPVESKQTFGMIVAHELAHQWFGDLVTPAWWDDIWLNESFANWMGYRIGEEWRPDLNIGVDALREGFDAMELDALVAGRPIHERITNDSNIDGAFDQITYGKGGHVVGMVAAYLGDEKFRDGVRLHMRRYAHGNASTNQFFDSLASAAQDPRVLAALQSFVDQQGVPVVTLSRVNGALTATQSRYTYFGTNAPNTQWVVPLCLRQAEVRSCTLLDKPSMTVEAKGQGIAMPNAGGWGYYRFEMDAADWNTLIATGATLPEAEAVALTDSLWASFFAGRAKLPQLVALARVLRDHPSDKVALDNGNRLRSLVRRGLIDEAALPAYRALMVDLYGAKLSAIGFDPAAGAYAAETHEQRDRRASLARLVIGTGREPALKAKLLAALDAFLAGDAKALDPSLLSLAVSIAANERPLDFSKGLVTRALDEKAPAVRQGLGRGIASSANPEVARWFINEFQDPRVGPADRYGAVVPYLESPATRDIASDYLFANFGAMSQLGGGIFSARAPQMFINLCSAESADAVDAKLRPQLARGSELSLDRTVETIRNCARFKDAKAAEVSAAVLGK